MSVMGKKHKLRLGELVIAMTVRDLSGRAVVRRLPGACGVHFRSCQQMYFESRLYRRSFQ